MKSKVKKQTIQKLHSNSKVIVKHDQVSALLMFIGLVVISAVTTKIISSNMSKSDINLIAARSSARSTSTGINATGNVGTASNRARTDSGVSAIPQNAARGESDRVVVNTAARAGSTIIAPELPAPEPVGYRNRSNGSESRSALRSPAPTRSPSAAESEAEKQAAKDRAQAAANAAAIEAAAQNALQTAADLAAQARRSANTIANQAVGVVTNTASSAVTMTGVTIGNSVQDAATNVNDSVNTVLSYPRSVVTTVGNFADTVSLLTSAASGYAEYSGDQMTRNGNGSENELAAIQVSNDLEEMLKRQKELIEAQKEEYIDPASKALVDTTVVSDAGSTIKDKIINFFSGLIGNN